MQCASAGDIATVLLKFGVALGNVVMSAEHAEEEAKSLLEGLSAHFKFVTESA